LVDQTFGLSESSSLVPDSISEFREVDQLASQRRVADGTNVSL